MTMVASPPQVAIKVAIRCGGRDCAPVNKRSKLLAVVPVELLDKGIEIICPRCGHRNVFD